jgi:hypothetical protein
MSNQPTEDSGAQKAFQLLYTDEQWGKMVADLEPEWVIFKESYDMLKELNFIKATDDDK